jgi:putative PIN family toxin of toxin-antitoxin system
VIRVVVDTNVLVSAMISSTGNEALLMLAINHGLLIPCFCAEVLREYSDVLSRPKFGFSQGEVKSLFDLLRQRGLELGSITISRMSPDPEDDKFMLAPAPWPKKHSFS